MHRFVIIAASLAMAAPAFAQFGPGGARPGGPQAPEKEKEEGPAEQAPEEKTNESPALQPLPAWPQQREKQLQFLQLNGYIRFRAYLFHNLNMGAGQSTGGPTPPFHVPFSEIGSSGQANPPAGVTNPAPSCAARNKSNCKE